MVTYDNFDQMKNMLYHMKACFFSHRSSMIISGKKKTKYDEGNLFLFDFSLNCGRLSCKTVGLNCKNTIFLSVKIIAYGDFFLMHKTWYFTAESVIIYMYM